MKTKMYVDDGRFIAGMTMKDGTEPEQNNMALHACENAEMVVENRKRLAEFMNCSLEDFVCAHQTHSASFRRVTPADKGRGADLAVTAIPDTDALYTFEPNTVLCSFTADCVPVIFYSEKAGLTGVIHSGWQGTVKEISLKLFVHLKQAEQIDLNDVHVQIGAALSQEKFEVDEDVYVKFGELGYADELMYYNRETSKYHIDNQLTVKRQCELAGIPGNQITVDRTCTFLNPDGFSYRQDKKAGRHLSFIMRRE